MLIPTTINKWFVIFGLAMLTMGCGKALMSSSQAKEWFEANKNVVLEVNRTLLSNPTITRVDPGMRPQVVENYSRFDDDTKQIYSELELKASSLGIKNIAIFRGNSVYGGKPINVRYILQSDGIVTSSGWFISVEYRLGENGLPPNPEEEILPLDVKDWFVVVYRHTK